MYCLIATSLRSDPDHFSRAQCEWFAARGGVLVHLPADDLEPYEHWIGLGVDRDVVRPQPGMTRDRVLFDFPRSRDEDASAQFDPAMLAVARSRFPELMMVGSGPPDSPLRLSFDAWVPYGQPHAEYTRQTLGGAMAFIPGWGETMGVPVAEAQVAGACVVHSKYQVPDFMLCPEANVPYEAGDPESLTVALAEARHRDTRRISTEAGARFDFFSVCRRTRRAIGLEPLQEHRAVADRANDST